MIAVANICCSSTRRSTACSEQFTHALGFPSHNWLGDRKRRTSRDHGRLVWKEAGFFMIFYLAALQTVSPTLGRGGRDSRRFAHAVFLARASFRC